MASAGKLTTIVSTKGQVILPKTIRQRQGRSTGTRLLVEETPDGVIFKRAPAFAEASPADVFASLVFAGAPKTLEEMDAAVLAEARHRQGRDHAGN